MNQKNNQQNQALKHKKKKKNHDEAKIDEALMESFPASDPPFFNAGTASTKKRKKSR